MTIDVTTPPSVTKPASATAASASGAVPANLQNNVKAQVQSCLTRIDLESTSEEKLFHQQRVICGWKDKVVPQMFEEARQGKRTLFWICVPSPTPFGTHISTDGKRIRESSPSVSSSDDVVHEGLGRLQKEDEKEETESWIHIKPLVRSSTDVSPSPSPSSTSSFPSSRPPSLSLLPVGHISIDLGDLEEPKTELLGTFDGEVMAITSLFVLPTYRILGLGSWAMKESERLVRTGSPPLLEGMAKSKPCRQIALSTMANRHFVMPGPDGVGMWKRCGVADGTGHEKKYHGPWYGGMGYDLVAEMPKFPDKTVDGEKVFWYAELWTKNLV